jgi:hypothetical protein
MRLHSWLSPSVFRIPRSIFNRFSGGFPFLPFRPQANGGGSEAGDSGTDNDGIGRLVERLYLISGGFFVDSVYIRIKLYVAVVNII